MEPTCPQVGWAASGAFWPMDTNKYVEESGPRDSASRVPSFPNPTIGPIGRAHCLHCGYNLRGLAGDPVRCPECFHNNPRNQIIGPAVMTRRLRELQGAGDAFVLATVSFCGGAALWWWDHGPLPLAAPVI